ncbi:hypothetical protein GCM10009762_23090 [Dermacoccus barathri]|uniref:Uncharacterized protein n=1 Tax=Dermacoccus barathri TaxID=322601 RepID=A0ABN2BXQ8_9MICO
MSSTVDRLLDGCMANPAWRPGIGLIVVLEELERLSDFDLLCDSQEVTCYFMSKNRFKELLEVPLRMVSGEEFLVAVISPDRIDVDVAELPSAFETIVKCLPYQVANSSWTHLYAYRQVGQPHELILLSEHPGT